MWEGGVDRGVQSEERSAHLSFSLGELSFSLSLSLVSPLLHPIIHLHVRGGGSAAAG